MDDCNNTTTLDDSITEVVVFSSDEAATNQNRCREILECKRQIQYWRSKLDVLEEEQTVYLKLAKLRVCAVANWQRLSREEKNDKKYILAALESPILPSALEDFQNSGFPPSIRMDKDILLARVARDDFYEKYEEERLFIPPNLRGEKCVILSIIPKHVAVVECMACTLRDDSDIFRAVLSSRSLPSHVLQHFSDRIRSDRGLMLELCAHKDGVTSMSFMDQELRNDKEFMLQAIQVSHRHEHYRNVDESSDKDTHKILRYASTRLRDDFDVVFEAVKKCGLNLKYASYNLRRDKTIVLTANEQNGTAFRYCLPGDVMDELLTDRDFVATRLLKNAHPNVIRLCMKRLKADRDFVLLALENKMEWSQVPCDMAEDKAFVQEALKRDPTLYLEIPATLQSDYNIARQVIESDKVTDDVILEATEQCPEMLSNRDVILAIAEAWWTDVLQETLKFSPIEIRSDKEVMLEAVKNDPLTYELCSDELLNDLDIVLAAIERQPSLLYLIDESLLSENPDIVICAIENSFGNDMWAIYDEVPSEVWANRDVAIAWLSNRGQFVPDFPKEFEKDEELALLLAKGFWTDLGNVSSSLLGDKEFMTKAVALGGNNIIHAKGDLRYDFDLLVLAFSQDRGILNHYSDADNFEFMVSFTDTLRKKLEEYDTFLNVVKYNILRPHEKKKDCCPLSLLNQGSETARSYSNMIASYLGLSNGEEATKLRVVSEHLLQWGF
jgi:hypothetical protein